MWLGASQNTAFHVLNATFAFPALARRANIRITQSGLEQKVIGQRKSLDLEYPPEGAAVLRKEPDASQDLQDVLVLRSATSN